jgi:hypothetical protein
MLCIELEILCDDLASCSLITEMIRLLTGGEDAGFVICDAYVSGRKRYQYYSILLTVVNCLWWSSKKSYLLTKH